MLLDTISRRVSLIKEKNSFNFKCQQVKSFFLVYIVGQGFFVNLVVRDCTVLALAFWRRRFGADVLVPMF